MCIFAILLVGQALNAARKGYATTRPRQVLLLGIACFGAILFIVGAYCAAAAP